MADNTVDPIEQQKLDAANANNDKKQMVKYALIAFISGIIIWFAFKSFK